MRAVVSCQHFPLFLQPANRAWLRKLLLVVIVIYLLLKTMAKNATSSTFPVQKVIIQDFVQHFSGLNYRGILMIWNHMRLTPSYRLVRDATTFRLIFRFFLQYCYDPIAMTQTRVFIPIRVIWRKSTSNSELSLRISSRKQEGYRNVFYFMVCIQAPDS